MTTIDEMIRIEYESMKVAIFPWERLQHAERIVKIVKLERILENQRHGWLEVMDVKRLMLRGE